MSIEKRVERLEQQNGGSDEFVVLHINAGESEACKERIISRWELETGRKRPRLVIFLVNFGSDDE